MDATTTQPQQPNLSVYKYHIMKRVIHTLRVKDIRHLFMLMRKTPNVNADYVFPKYGMTCGEFATGYVLNMPHRSSKH